MNIQTAYPSKNLKAADIEESEMVLTMKDVQMETVGQGKNAEDKPVLYFEETEKSLVLNKTNANAISQLYGPDTDGWGGKRIALFSTTVDFAGTPTLAIRVHLKKPGGAGAGSKAPAKPGALTGKSSAPPSGVPMKARSEAWQAFIDATPDFDEPTRKTKWGEALKEIFPTQAEKSLNAEEWFAFAEKIKESYDGSQGTFLPF